MKNMLNGKNKSHKLKKKRIMDTKRTSKATNTVTKQFPKTPTQAGEPGLPMVVPSILHLS